MWRVMRVKRSKVLTCIPPCALVFSNLVSFLDEINHARRFIPEHLINCDLPIDERLFCFRLGQSCRRVFTHQPRVPVELLADLSLDVPVRLGGTGGGVRVDWLI